MTLNKKIFKMPDTPLGKPKRKFSETFRVITLLEEKFFKK